MSPGIVWKSDDFGLTNTVNPISAATVYQLSTAEGGYRFDGKVLRFTAQ